MARELIQTRVDGEIKRAADALFASMGLSTQDAVRMFLHQSVTMGGLPFQPVAKIPNETTLAAMKDAEEGRVHRAESLEEFYNDLGI